MENTDPRYVRSRLKLRAALLEIAHDDPAKLSVSAVCERTGIDRATFYRHFDTLDDLVADALADYADRSTREWEAKAAGTGVQYAESSAIFAQYLQHIEDNWALYQWVLGPTGSAKTVHALLRQFARGTAAELQQLDPALSPTERDLRAAYIAGGIFGACVHWLASARPDYSASELTAQLLRIGEQSLETVAG